MVRELHHNYKREISACQVQVFSRTKNKFQKKIFFERAKKFSSFKNWLGIVLIGSLGACTSRRSGYAGGVGLIKLITWGQNRERT